MNKKNMNKKNMNKKNMNKKNMNKKNMNKENCQDSTKLPGLELAELLNGVEDEFLLESQNLQPKPLRRSWYKGLVAVLAAALLFSCSSLAWAVNTLKQENREFYLRYLTPELLAFEGGSGGDVDILQQPELLFAALESEDLYYQYIAINRLVELYNDPKLRKQAVRALQPFLNSQEPKLAEAAAFALDILQEDFQSSRLCYMADGRIFFTLFNDYSDYGSHNQIWQIKDGQLTMYTSFAYPMEYITQLLPSPDGRLLAVSLSSNKSHFAVIIDAENGYFSSELVGSARALWANQLAQWGVTNRLAVIRTDYETYCGCRDLRWLDNNTLAFEADLSYDDGDTAEYCSCEIVDVVSVSYNYPARQFSFVPVDVE